MNDLYPYADGNLIEEPNTYFYSAYEGLAFFEAWRQSREAVRRILPNAGAPSRPRNVDGTSDMTSDLLERAIAGDETLREAVVRKFEITKRIHARYDKAFRAVDKSMRRDLSLYVRAADLFEASYDARNSLRHLNVYLKCLDTLCAHADELSDALGARLSWHIGRERSHIETLANENGVTL